MENLFVTVLSVEELENLFISCLHRFEKEKTSSGLKEETFSINKVAKRLGRAHGTIKCLVRDGILKTTADQRRITALSLNEYVEANLQK